MFMKHREIRDFVAHITPVKLDGGVYGFEVDFHAAEDGQKFKVRVRANQLLDVREFEIEYLAQTGKLFRFPTRDSLGCVNPEIQQDMWLQLLSGYMG
ncbi:MAG: hypothetical protein WD768_12695 [Phycisphaeraceae bacterium]